MVDKGRPGMTSLRMALSVRASLGIMSRSAVALNLGNKRYLRQGRADRYRVCHSYPALVCLSAPTWVERQLAGMSFSHE